MDEFFRSAVGIDDVCESWRWPGMRCDAARTKLDKYVSLRGDIAHRGAAAEGVRKGDVTKFRNHVDRLVAVTDDHVNVQVSTAVGVALF